MCGERGRGRGVMGLSGVSGTQRLMRGYGAVAPEWHPLTDEVTREARNTLLQKATGVCLLAHSSKQEQRFCLSLFLSWLCVRLCVFVCSCLCVCMCIPSRRCQRVYLAPNISSKAAGEISVVGPDFSCYPFNSLGPWDIKVEGLKSLSGLTSINTHTHTLSIQQGINCIFSKITMES